MSLFEAKSLDSLYVMEDSGIKGLVLKLVNEYEKSASQLVENIMKAIEIGDLHRLEMAAHTLRSSSRIMGLDDLAQICEDIERNLQKKMDLPDSISKIPTFFEQGISLLKEYTSQRR